MSFVFVFMYVKLLEIEAKTNAAIFSLDKKID